MSKDNLPSCPLVTNSPDSLPPPTKPPDAASPKQTSEQGSKLCGYLNKLGTRGPLKTSKRRWFMYSENTCKLFYYKTAQDSTHIGEIDISKATFSFEVTNIEKPGLFFISTPEKSYELEAKDREACLFWLQELQLRRKEFSRRCTAQLLSNTKLNKVHSVGKLESGLLRRQNSNISQLSSVEDVAISNLLIPVGRPVCDVGEEAAEECDRSHRSWSFSSLKDQVSKKVHRHTPGHPHVPESSPPHSPPTEDDMQRPKESPPPSPTPDTDTLLSPKKNSKRWRFSNSFRVKENKISQPKVTCKRCEQLEEDLACANQHVLSVKDETETSREVIKVLQDQLDYFSRQHDTLLKNGSQENVHDDHSNQKVHEISEMFKKLHCKEEENKRITSELQSTRSELQSMKEQLAMYQTAVQVKDEVLVQLTNQLSVFEDDDQQSKENNITAETNPATSPVFQDYLDIDKLKDTLHAFQLQNKFLNKEILELNQLRKECDDRQERLLVRCSEWEAKYYQIQSKYLLLLNELHTPHKKDDKQAQEIVSQLFEDALFLQVQPNYAKAQTVITSESEYDEFGFTRVKETEDVLRSKASDLQKRSQILSNYIKDPEAEMWHKRWENYIVNLGNRDMNRDLPDTKSLLRSGIPYEHKGTIWKKCVNMWVKPLKEKLKPGYYQRLLDTHRSITMLDAAAKQIELDLLRTLPNNKHYETLQSDGIPRLRRVLLAYSWHNSEVGYCQGLNRLAAIALLFMNEEDAFWCLVAIIECIMPQDYYSKTLIASQVDQRVLKDIFAEKLPRLHAHLDSCSVDLSLFTFNWFLCVFVDNIPVEVYLRIWDIYLFEGTKVLFRYALAFFKIHEEESLQIRDAMSFNYFIRTAAENFLDIKRLSQIAFHELNPFRMRVIKTKRHHHMQVVKAELEELEKMRREFRVRSEPRMDYVDSEEEET